MGRILGPSSTQSGVMIQVQRLSHITHAVRDRPAAVEVYQRVLGAKVFHEGHVDLTGRDATCLVLADLCVELVDAAALGYEGNAYIAKYGGLLHSLVIRVPDVASAEAGLRASGVRSVQSRPHHRIVDPATTQDVPMEFVDADLPDDPRARPDWDPSAWTWSPMLQIQSLWSVSVLTRSVAATRDFMVGTLGAREVGYRYGGENTKISYFSYLGSSRIALLEPKSDTSPLGQVMKTQGVGVHGINIHSVDTQAAARFLRSQGLGVMIEDQRRMTVHPRSFFGARIMCMGPLTLDDPYNVWQRDALLRGQGKA